MHSSATCLLLLAVFFVFSPGARAAVVPESTPNNANKCYTKHSGYLSIYNDKPFAFNYRGELAFFHNTTHLRINSQFQYCYPNWYGTTLNSDRDRPGRVYLPDLKKCLAVKNQKSKGPYVLHAAECPNSAKGEMATPKSWPFNFKAIEPPYSYPTFTFDWIGSSKDDLSQLQGGCPDKEIYFKGKEYPEGSGNQEPLTNKTGNYRLYLECVYGQFPTAGGFGITPD